MPIPPKKIEVVKTARERVYSEVREWIINGTLKPEEKIYDQEIAQYFSVSRTPVREAIQLLADQRLVNIYSGRETRVAPVNFDTINSIYSIAAELHALALSMAYPHITENHIRTLKEYNKLFTLAVQRQDNIDASHNDQLFHDVFISLADNYFLSDFLKTLEAHIRRIKLMDDPNYNLIGKGMISADTHNKIIEALEKQELEQAIEYMKHNWLYIIEFATDSQH